MLSKFSKANLTQLRNATFMSGVEEHEKKQNTTQVRYSYVKSILLLPAKTMLYTPAHVFVNNDTYRTEHYVRHFIKIS